jgi:hypothetical protein
MRNNVLMKILLLALLLLPLFGCGIGRKGSGILKLNPYQRLAFYGKVVDKVTHETPDCPVTISLQPEDPGNHVVVDSCIFFIEDNGLDPVYEYTLVIGAEPDYARIEIPVKYLKNKAQNLGIIELENIGPGNASIKLKPFKEFSPGAGILEKPGWSISSFIGQWKSVDQPFTLDDVEQYIRETLPPGSPEISKSEIKQAVDGWVKDGLVKSAGKNSYILK